jgi:two-component system, OmpR family, sensor histidine kinase CreC
MRLGIRLLFAFFIINGMAAFFVLRVFSAEIKPSVREVMEDMLIDTANILAELAADELAAGQLTNGRFANHVQHYATRPIDAKIWGLTKQSLDLRIYVTNAQGVVQFDSSHTSVGQDYSQWNDVALTLRGQYGARVSREIKVNDQTSIMYVAAPVMHAGQMIGVLTVAKPLSTIQRFIDRAEQKIARSGVLLLALSALVGVLITAWVVWSIRRLRNFALGVQAGENPTVPNVSGELGELAQAMQIMHTRLEGREYIEGYVRALTHELKSPMAAIRASGELLQDDLSHTDRHQFANQVIEQTERVQRLIDRLLKLTKLEQRALHNGRLQHLTPVSLQDCVHNALHPLQAKINAKNIQLNIQINWKTIPLDSELITLALSNLLENALDFSPPSSQIRITCAPQCIAIQDQAGGVPSYALPRLGERFFTTPRPNGERSGSGLGLAIVKQIMALHGGQLRITNVPNGLRAELIFAS